MRPRGRWAQALRTVVRNPSYAAGVVVTLGLGIGITASAFSVLRGVLLRPLPHADGERLVYVRHSAPGAGLENFLFSVPEIADLREGVASFTGVAEFSRMQFTALDLERPREVEVGIVTGNWFEVMGLGTVLGRPFGAGDDGEQAAPVAVLTQAMWRSEFGGDPDLLGRTFRMNGRTVTVVGVAEPHPPYPERTDMYVNMVTSPHHLSASMSHDRSHRMTEVFARLAPGATIGRAHTEVTTVAERMRVDHPEAYEDGYAHAVSTATLKDQLARRARTILMVLISAAALVFLVALANVANLTLTRASRMAEELAVRASLGATSTDLRGRILRENLLLGAFGALFGAVVALGGMRVLSEWIARFTVRAAEVHMDLQVLALAVALGVGAAAALAFLPRLPAERGLDALARAGRQGGRKGLHRAQGFMVSAQVAVSLVLVFGAGLLVRTVTALQSVDTGLALESVLALDVPVVQNGRTQPEILADHLAMADEVRALPGVSSAALTNSVPLRSDGLLLPWTVDFVEEGREPMPGTAPRRADFRTVTPEYFETLGMRVVSGRALSDADDVAATRVVVVNEAFVERFMDGRDPLGVRLMWTSDFVRFMGLANTWFSVAGVVSDAREVEASAAPVPTVFLSHHQAPFGRSLLVRVQGDPARVAGAVEAAIRRVEPDQPVENVAPLAEVRSAAIGDRRLNAQLVASLALLSLAIAAVGIFSALAFSVSQRTREMGVRIALGADAGRVVRFVMREGLAVVGLGLAVGMAGAWAVSGVLRGLVWGVPLADPVTLAGGAAGLVLVAAVATALPALRAARVDPARVLGQE